MFVFHRLSSGVVDSVSPGLPPQANCNLINGIPRRLRIGAPSRNVPGKYGKWIRSLGL